MGTNPLLRAVRVGMLLAAVAWAVLVVVSPWLAVRATAPGRLAAAGAYLVGSVVCHQRPERSFHVVGAQLPVCARCTGLYVSAALGVAGWLVVGWWWRARYRQDTTAGVLAPSWRTAILVTAAPTAVTFGLEVMELWPSGNLVRAAAAVPLGVVAGALLAESMSFRGRL